jgi:putative nucleotidyltransferase with HDIG domain
MKKLKGTPGKEVSQSVEEESLSEAPVSEEVRRHMEAQLLALDDFPDDDESVIDDVASNNRVKPVVLSTTFSEEASIAKEIQTQAQENVKRVLGDIAAGRPIACERVEESSAQLLESFQRNSNAMLALALLQQEDNNTFVHSVNVATYLMAFSLYMGFDEQAVINIGMGGMLHDVGLAYLIAKGKSDPKYALKKGANRIVESHVDHGVRVLQNLQEIPEEVIIIASLHHERSNGAGYPKGLLGEDIHIIGKMAGIVDEFDRMGSDHPTNTLKKMLKQENGNFDSDLIQMFIKAIGIYPVGSMVELQNGSIAVVAENDSEALLQPVVHVVYNKKRKKCEQIQRIDLKRVKKGSTYHIKSVIRMKRQGFDALGTLLAPIKEN